MTKSADFILTNALVLTMDEEFHQYDPGAVAVRAIASWLSARRQRLIASMRGQRRSIAAEKC